MWTYRQTSGEMLHDGVLAGTGYSGHSEGRNSPAHQSEARVGPIPQGRYIIGQPYHHPHLGPIVMNVDAEPGTNTFGRDLFRIHGDSTNHDASLGCIILGPSVRAAIAASHDRELTVTA